MRRSLPNAPSQVTCTAQSYTAIFYLNYKFSPLDNISLRAEFYDDMEGQRTGTKTRYLELAVGWQHWLSPQVELRPEIAYYHSLDALPSTATSMRYRVRGRRDHCTEQEFRVDRRHGFDLALLALAAGRMGSQAPRIGIAFPSRTRG